MIIPARPDQAEIKAVGAARNFDYPAELLEILVARGKQPSAQRNTAVRAAQGEWIYFLDDDSVPPPGNLRQIVQRNGDPAVKMVGGPSLCPPDAPALEQVFATVLSSWLAFGPSRARYTRVGAARAASEKELILCNLAARRDAVLELGGFNEALYPNEENALMDTLQKRGGQLIYDPGLHIYRRPRRTLKSFARMLMTYGRGRAEQFRVRPTLGSALNFIPPLFCVYLVLTVVLQCVAPASPLARWSLPPLGAYVLAILVQTAASMPAHGVARSLSAVPLLAASHILYGIGFWRGMFTRLRSAGERPPGPGVVIEKISH